MYITLICILITAFGSILEYRKSVVKSEKKLFKLSKYILFFGILGLIGNNVKQEIEGYIQAENYDNLRNDNKIIGIKLDSTRNELKQITNKYDSLKFQYAVINNRLDMTENQLKELGNTTVIGFQNNEDYLKSIETKNLERQRILTTEQQDIIYNEIVEYKKSKILIDYPAFGDQENAKFAKYFIELFRKAGWIVETREVVGGTDNNMTEVNIILKSIEYEPKKEIYNCLNRAFEKAGLKFKFRIDASSRSFEEIRLHINKG